MGHGCRGERLASGPRSLAFLGVLAAVTAALIIHLFGSALQGSSTAEAGADGGSALELTAADSKGADLGYRAAGHDEGTCHSVPAVAPAATVQSAPPCHWSTWVKDPAVGNDRSRVRPAWNGGDGGNASLDPRRSPGVQRT